VNPVSNPQDAAEIANDLHTLLQRADVPGPYVLAGHSFGGLYVLTYADLDLYPDDVAGLALGSARPRRWSYPPGQRTDGLGRSPCQQGGATRLGATTLGSIHVEEHFTIFGMYGVLAVRGCPDHFCTWKRKPRPRARRERGNLQCPLRRRRLRAVTPPGERLIAPAEQHL
jgi:pimeloyl-ACP methyl ester carboxylesterase